MIGTIYRIYLANTQESYVGVTKQDIKFVWDQAESKLLNKKHSCKALQEAVNQHGMAMVGFEVLEKVEEEQLAEAQAKWMRQFICFNKKVFTKPRKARTGKPVVWNGIEYPSITAAANASGLSVKQMRLRIEFGYENDGEFEPDPFTPVKVPTEWNGVQYPSIRAAAAATTIPYSKLRFFNQLGIKNDMLLTAYDEMQEAQERKYLKQKRVQWLEQRAQSLRNRLADIEALLEELRKE